MAIGGNRCYVKHVLSIHIYDTIYHLAKSTNPYKYRVLLRNSSRKMLISVGIDGSGAAAIRRRLPGCACTGLYLRTYFIHLIVT